MNHEARMIFELCVNVLDSCHAFGALADECAHTWLLMIILLT
jgi:hypothetical protein